MPSTFKVGDQAVYAGHGVGIITAIETKEISGSTQKFYSVRIQDSDISVLVPQSRTGEKGGLRPLASREKVLGVIDILKERELTVQGIHNWNKKLQEYAKKLKTGSLTDVACVLKDLSLIKATKNLSFGEKQLMGQAWSLFFREVSSVLGKEKSQTLLKNVSHKVFEQKH